MRHLFIQLNNWITRCRRIRVPGANVLLVVPHCLQASGCGNNVASDIDLCRRCGRCTIAGLLELRDRYGLLCNLAGGGRQAVQCVKRPDVKFVVAVACERELTAGILAAFPRPVLAVTNRTPNGPCKDTTVDLEQVDRAVRSAVRA